MIFCCLEKLQVDISVLKHFLDTFCEISGQTISIGKSRVLFSKNTIPSDRSIFNDALEIQEANDINSYLGFQSRVLVPPRPRVSLLCIKLADCVSSSLFSTRFPIIICNVSFWLSLSLNPLIVVWKKKLLRKERDKRGLHLLSWEKIAKPKEEGA